MYIYTYHESTKEYLSTEKAAANPLEPGKFLVPRCSTTKKPDFKEGCVPVFNTDVSRWEYVVNLKGEKVLNTHTGGIDVVTYIGELKPYHKQLTQEQIEEKTKELEFKSLLKSQATNTEKHIYSFYPQSKQNSDLADKMFYETTLKATGNYPTLESLIATAIADFYTAQASGRPVTTASLAQPLAVTTGDEVGIEQLIKVGIRVKWVQDCKVAYTQAVANIQAGSPDSLTLPTYPL